MYKLREVYGVYCDGLVVNEVNELLFISLIGSDSSIQELAGRLSLSFGSEGFLNQLTMTIEGKELQFNASLLSEKQAVRLPEHAKFTGVHCFWSSKQLLPQQMSEGNAFIMFDSNEAQSVVDKKVWNTAKGVSRLPLLDAWKNILVNEFRERKWITPLKCFGSIKAIHVSIPSEQMDFISSLVKQEVLSLT